MRVLPERRSIRLSGWDYRNSATYFITICTRSRKHFFGNIRSDSMHLSEIGVIARNEWLESPGIRPDMNLELGAFVVMPDHIHGIIRIGMNQYNQHNGVHDRVAMHGDPTSFTGNTFGPQRKNLASIIRGYKSAVTKCARLKDPGFAWQSRFFDHVIRTPQSEYEIQRYIQNNVKNWSR